MCGIIGYAEDDSAGIAVISPEGAFQVQKSKGRLAVLKEHLPLPKHIRCCRKTLELSRSGCLLIMLH